MDSTDLTAFPGDSFYHHPETEQKKYTADQEETKALPLHIVPIQNKFIHVVLEVRRKRFGTTYLGTPLIFETETNSIKCTNPKTGELELWSHPHFPEIVEMAAELVRVGDLKRVDVPVYDPFDFSNTIQFGTLWVQMVDKDTPEAVRASFHAQRHKLYEHLKLPEVVGASLLYNGILQICKSWMDFNATSWNSSS